MLIDRRHIQSSTFVSRSRKITHNNHGDVTLTQILLFLSWLYADSLFFSAMSHAVPQCRCVDQSAGLAFTGFFPLCLLYTTEPSEDVSRYLDHLRFLNSSLFPVVDNLESLRFLCVLSWPTKTSFI